MNLPDLLTESLKSGRVANSYLFYGRPVDSYRETVLEFFRQLLCKKNGCGECTDCQQVTNLTHPDLIAMPDTSTRIGVQKVRDDIIEPAHLTPVRSNRRVFWLNDIDRFTPEASNTLLKILEEPPGAGSVFVLTARSRWDCIATIRSRCQWVRFPVKRNVNLSTLEICRSFWPETDISENEFKKWEQLLSGEIHSGNINWNKKNARGFLAFLLVKINNYYSKNTDEQTLPGPGTISWRLVDELLERIEELQRGGKPVMIINSILEEIYYPEESQQWQHVI